MELLTWIRGNAQKSTYVKSITIVLAILLGGISSAALLYELPFSFLTVQISQLADLQDNPVGGLIFAACFIVAGILIVPHAVYLYKVLLPDVKIASGISASFTAGSGIGIIIVGLFPSGVNYTMHIVGAILAFGGIFVGALFSLFPAIKKLVRKAGWPNPWLVVVTYGQLAIITMLALSLVGIPILNEIMAGTYTSDFLPVLWPLCEWMLLFSAVAWAVGMVLGAPKQR